MLKHTGAKFIAAPSASGRRANFLKTSNAPNNKARVVHAADPDMILQACVFEIVTTQVEQIPIPIGLTALGQPVEKRNLPLRRHDLPASQRRDWGRNGSVPDVSRMETKLWFYYQAASYIDAGCEAFIRQVEI